MRNAALRNCFKLMEDTPGRLQFLLTLRNRSYYNDAASRNVNATWYALDEMQGGIIWITCGGEADYDRLMPLVQRKVRTILVLGRADALRDAFSSVVPNIVECDSMADAVRRAYYYDAPDANVIFSPATDNPELPSSDLSQEFIHEVYEL